MIKNFIRYVSLDSEVDNFETIHETIEKGVIFKGTNLWILVFAIIIASVGLNVNSTAVIIGAMLISPLMGPINGMGYSLATYNFPLFRKSVKNFTFAVIASLVASTAYFAISPVSTAHSELLARTTPTIYDVIIALSGGLAGIVAISSKQKGNVIPGVAIATALMPPLCTAGFGLATAQFNYFFGAIYLFTINTVFIALSSVVVSQILKFPIRTIVDLRSRTRLNRVITIVILITIIPSIYFGYGLVQNEKFTENATKFIRNVSIFEGNYLIKNEVIPDKKSIVLVYGGSTLNEEQKIIIKEKAKEFELENAKLDIKQGFSLDEVMNKQSEYENLKGEINKLNLMLKDSKKRADSIVNKPFIGKQLLHEVKSLYPQIIGCSYSDTYSFSDTLDIPSKTSIVVLSWKKFKFKDSDKEKINNWFKKRLNSESVFVYYDKIE
jgi:uncharacterized hydrophobic protein (TIGR00271 family)